MGRAGDGEMTPEQIALLAQHCAVRDLFNNVDGCECGWQPTFLYPDYDAKYNYRYAEHVAHEMREL